MTYKATNFSSACVKTASLVIPVLAVLLGAIPFAQQQNAHAQNQTLSCVGVQACYG